MPRRLMTRHTRILISFALLFAAGCGGGDSSNPVALDPTIGGTRQSGNLVYNATTTKRSFAAGEIVPVTLTVKNVGTVTVAGTFADCNDSNLSVSSASSSVWLYSDTIGGCTAQDRFFSLAPGQSLTKVIIWDQTKWDKTTRVGTTITAGTYTLKTWLNGISSNTSDLLLDTQKTTAYAPPIDITLTR